MSNQTLKAQMTKHKQTEKEQQTLLWFWESLDQVNRAIQGTNDMEQVLSDVSDILLSIFECDRVWIVYPCDPNSATWQLSMERTRPEYPSDLHLGVEMPQNPESASLSRILLDASGPVQFNLESEYQVPTDLAQKHSVQSLIAMAFFPKSDTPWSLALHQCTSPRVWLLQEARLFQEIGRRLADAWTNLLMFHDLQESKRNLEEAQRIAHLGHWEHNLQTDDIIGSDEMARIFGIASSDQHLDQFMELVHPEDRQTINQKIASAIRSGEIFDVEYRIVRPSGEVRYIHAQGTVIRDDTDKAQRIFGTIQDVTEQKLAEEKLRESNERFRLLAESSLTGIYLIQDNLFRYVNPAMAHIFGYEVEEIIDKLGPMDMVYPDDRPLVAENLRRRIAGEEEAIQYEFLGLRKDGSAIDIEVYGRRIEYSGKTGVIGTLMDITQRKQTEEALRRNRKAELQFSEQLAALQEVTNQLSKTESSDDLIRQAVQLGRSRLGFDRVSIWFIEEHLGIMRGSFGTNEYGELRDERDAQVEFKHEGLAWHAFSQKEPMAVVEQISLHDHLGQEVGEGDNAVAALWDGDEVVGVIFVDNLFSRKPIGEHRLDILRLYATTLGHLITQKRAEEAQRDSETRFRTLVEHAADAFFLHDETGTILDVNRQACASLSYSREELIGMSPTSFDAGNDRDRPSAVQVLSRLDAGETVTFETRHRRKDGSVFPVEVRTRPFWQGERRFSVSLAQDITDRKQAEKEHQTHLWFLESMDQVNRAIQGSSDLDQMMSDVLDVVLTIFGCDRAGLVYPCDPDADSWHVSMERTRPEYPGIRVLENEIPMDTDVAESFRIMRAANGPVKFGPDSDYPLPVEVSQRFGFQSFIGMALYPKLDKPWEFMLQQCSYPRVWTLEEERLFQEIGWRLADTLTSLLAYRNLQESERRYREVFDNVSDALYVYDVTAEGHFRFAGVNAAAERLSGISSANTYGKFIEEIVRPGVLANSLPNIHRCLERGEPLHYEEEYNSPTLGQRYLDTTLIPVRNEAGVISRLITFNRDITDHKRAEEKIRKLNRELEQRVTERTAQLEASNKELEAFAYSVSHDLRAPLRHVDGFLELLQKRSMEVLDERSQHYMNTISDAARRMGQLIDDLLTFSRMGRNEMSKAPVDLNVLVEEVIYELAPEVNGRSIQWHTAPLPTVIGDRAMLRLVLVNLVSNALKFTQGCTLANIEVGYQAGEKENVIFIRDNGVGFDMAYIDKLFGVFQRLHHTDEFEGTGIGLANVRRIINRHGGRTWAEGKINEGATFYFSLPHDF